MMILNLAVMPRMSGCKIRDVEKQSKQMFFSPPGGDPSRVNPLRRVDLVPGRPSLFLSAFFSKYAVVFMLFFVTI